MLKQVKSVIRLQRQETSLKIQGDFLEDTCAAETWEALGNERKDCRPGAVTLKRCDQRPDRNSLREGTVGFREISVH